MFRIFLDQWPLLLFYAFIVSAVLMIIMEGLKRYFKVEFKKIAVIQSGLSVYVTLFVFVLVVLTIVALITSIFLEVNNLP